MLDYLAEEVLPQEPARIQALLLLTSVLDRFCGSLCDALTQTGNGQETLKCIERWYRYHRLFGRASAAARLVPRWLLVKGVKVDQVERA